MLGELALYCLSSESHCADRVPSAACATQNSTLLLLCGDRDRIVGEITSCLRAGSTRKAQKLEPEPAPVPRADDGAVLRPLVRLPSNKRPDGDQVRTVRTAAS